MPRIRRLPEDVASRIAAGEVIERPASVLKELLENALDAGAAKVTVEARGAGRESLRVTDDGCGMEPADCRLAFDRHATSKIDDLEDLESLTTFGFRGEALYAISAVSKTTLTSCPKGTRKGWTVEAQAGKVKAEHEAPPVVGTTVEVRELFFNTPARAKFLKSDASEKSHLLRVVEEAALANPGVAFLYKSEGRTALDFPASKGDGLPALRGRVVEVLGTELGDSLVPVEEESPRLRLRAWIGGVDGLASTRGLQHWFVNRRPVTSRLLQQALYRAYEPFRGSRHPVCVVWLDLDPARFDVNVHPAKREVRFREERGVFEAVTGALSGALLRTKGIPSVVAGRLGAGGFGAPPLSVNPPKSKLREAITNYNASAGSSGAVDREAPLLDLATGSPYSVLAPTSGAPRWWTPPFRYLGSVESSYLVFDAAGGLLLVDQHAAQEKILFERYLSQIEEGKVKVQRLMLPVAVELPASKVQAVLAQGERLKRDGFEVEPFGKLAVHVTAAPALLQEAGELKEVVERLLDGLESPGSAAADAKRDALATVACKAAVKAHDKLSPAEAMRLLEDLKDCRDGTCCPHGRPSMISLSRDELARRFHRPGAPPR